MEQDVRPIKLRYSAVRTRMAFVRTYNKRGRQYRALVEDYRDGAKVRQRILKWLGPVGGYKRARSGRGTVAYDVQGAFMLGLPFRIVYDLVSGRRVEQLHERLSRPAWVSPEDRHAQARIRELYDRFGFWQQKGLPVPVPGPQYGTHFPADPREWAKHQADIQAFANRAATPSSSFDVRERIYKVSHSSPSYRAKQEYAELRELNQRQWANYNAVIGAHFDRINAGNAQYARERGWASSTPPAAPQAVSIGSAPASPASDAPASDGLGQTPDASPADAPGSSEPQ